MRIEHLAIWCENLEKMKHFYQYFLDANCNDKYENSINGLRSYFMTFSDGPNIELMQMDPVLIAAVEAYPQFTLAHIAFSVGSEFKVDQIASTFVANGYEVQNGPNWTKEGCYMCVVLDPEYNRVEIVV